MTPKQRYLHLDHQPVVHRDSLEVPLLHLLFLLLPLEMKRMTVIHL